MTHNSKYMTNMEKLFMNDSSAKKQNAYHKPNN